MLLLSSWILNAIMGMVAVSFLMAFFKVPAARKIDLFALGVWSYCVAALSALGALFPWIVFDPQTLWYAFLWGTGYAALTTVQMKVLHIRDTSGVFPFTSLASNILIVLSGVLFFHEVISLLQWGAIVLSVVLFTWYSKKDRLHFSADVLPSFILISLLSTFNKIIQKIGAGGVEPHNFIFWQLLFAFIASSAIWVFARRGALASSFQKKGLFLWGISIGLLQFGSTYFIIRALSMGPLSLVYIILGLYTFCASIIAAVLFHEKITRKNVIVLCTSIVVVLLIKLGA